MYPIRTARKYDPSNLLATAHIYTTVYLGTYIEGDYLEGNGSHLGVDIIPMTPHDDVVAPLPGVVTVAASNALNGNYVIIRHDGVPDPDDFSRTTTLHSVYLHLDSLSVAAGTTVTEGQKIGTSGSTGNSSGEHLHFQIDRDTAPYHPYWPFTTAEASAAGYGFFQATNAGLGLDKAKLYTVNPLVYLDRVADRGLSASTPRAADVAVANADVIAAPISEPEPIREPDPIVELTPIREPEPVADTSGFSDVPASHRYREAILSLKDRGVVSGNGGKFYPDNNISRAELLKMVFLAGKIPTAGGSAEFHDVDAGAWYAPYVATARARGIVGGYEDGSFRPNNPVTRAEALKIIVNTLAPGLSAGMEASAFTDIEIGAWYAPYAELVRRKGLMDFQGSSFNAGRFMTRAEVASVIAGLAR